jgi:hypothetical protein
MAKSFKAQKLHHNSVHAFSFLNRTCSIMIKEGKFSLAFLVLIFEIAKLYFLVLLQCMIMVFSFVVVLSIGFANVRLDQT